MYLEIMYLESSGTGKCLLEVRLFYTFRVTTPEIQFSCI